MILYQWRGAAPNFGDELNSLLWPRLLPSFFDQDESTRFLGIGSVLDDRHDRRAIKLVAGSGYGGYERRIELDETWVIHWVRGQHTARGLNLPPELGLGDPASLLPLSGLAPAAVLDPGSGGTGFMPHFESAMRGAWQEVCDAAGVTLIDPRGDPHAIIAAIAACRVVLSEALHGAIVADALRVPWIAIRPLAPIHRPKWFDWAETLGLRLEFHTVPPSSALERVHLSRLSDYHMGRRVMHRRGAMLRGIASRRHIDRAADAMRLAAGAEPRLSGDAMLDRAQSRMLETIAVLRGAPMHGWRDGATTRSCR
jgi:succinoglycan biosynthesis protein ExoV